MKRFLFVLTGIATLAVSAVISCNPKEEPNPSMVKKFHREGERWNTETKRYETVTPKHQ